MLLVKLALYFLHLHDEVTHQKINDGRHASKVQGEEKPDGFHRHAIIDASPQVVIKKPGGHGHKNISDEPRNRIAPTRNDQGTYRGEQCPEHHTAGSDRTAYAPLHDERNKQEQT